MMVEQSTSAAVGWPEPDDALNESSEGSVVAPKPSAIRRSGKLQYVRRHRSRLNYAPPARRPIGEPKNESSSPNTEEPMKDKESKDDLVNTSQTSTSSPAVVEPIEPAEEKKVDDDASLNHGKPPAPESEVVESPAEPKSNNNLEADSPADVQPILDDKLFGYTENSDRREDEPVVELDNEQPAASSGPIPEQPKEQNNNHTSGITRTIAAVPSVAEEDDDEPVPTRLPHNFPSITRSSSSSSMMKTKVYHRPHTNQTVVAGGADDQQSVNSEPSQTSWVERRKKGDEEHSASSRNAMRHARKLAKRSSKKPSKKKSRKRVVDDSSQNSNPQTLGRFVSHTFDKILGIHHDEDGYSSDESENIITVLQDSLFSTFGCSVPAGVKPIKTVDEDDASSVETHNTGRSSNVSSVRHSHVRSESGMSQSVMSGISSVFSFETTEELADFQENKAPAAAAAKKKANFKVPDVSDPSNPPKLQEKINDDTDAGSVKSAKSHQMYSKNLYSNITEPDFEPVDLLSESDTMFEDVNKIGSELLKTANSKVDEVFTQIQSLLGSGDNNSTFNTFDSMDDTNTLSTGYDNHTLSTAGGYSVNLMPSMSNVSEPLQVIKEAEAESPRPKKQPDEVPIEEPSFEDRFEVNVFETLEVEEDSPSLVKVTVETTEDETNDKEEPANPITEADDARVEAVSVFEDDEQDSLVQVLDERLQIFEETDTKVFDSFNTNFGASFVNDSIKVLEEGSPMEITDTSMTSSEKTPVNESNESSFLDTSAEESGASFLETSAEESKDRPVDTSSESINQSSTEVASKSPETKKKKKSGLKGFIRRSFQKSKKNKKQRETPPRQPSSVNVDASPKGTNAVQKNAPTSPTRAEPVVESLPVIGSRTPPRDEFIDTVDFDTSKPNEKKLESRVGPDENTNDPISCPTTPDPDSSCFRDTPKMSNTVIGKLRKPSSSTNLSGLIGISEMMASVPTPEHKLRQKPEATSPKNAFDMSFETGFEFSSHSHKPAHRVDTTKNAVSTKSFDEDKELSFDDFEENFGFASDWESFGGSGDVGASAFRPKATLSRKTSPHKVSDFPGC